MSGMRNLSSRPPRLDEQKAEAFIAGAAGDAAEDRPARPGNGGETIRLTATMAAADAAALEAVGRRALERNLMPLPLAGNKSYLMQLAARCLAGLDDGALAALIDKTPPLKSAR